MSGGWRWLTLIGLTIAGAGGVAWHHAQVRADAAAARSAFERKGDELEIRIRWQTARLKAAEADAAKLREAQKPLRGVKEVKATVAKSGNEGSPSSTLEKTSSGEAVRRKPDYLELLQTDPAVQAHMLQAQRVTLATTYDVFFRQSGLSAEQIEKVKDEMMQKDARMADLQSAARAQGVSAEDPSLSKMWSAIWDDYWQAQEKVLGWDGVQRLKDYEKTAYQRDLVRGVAGAAVVAGVPFSAEQAERLTQVLAELSRAKVVGGSGAATMDWRAVDEAARAFLTPEQMVFLQTAEPSGPRGAGWRFIVQMNRLIGDAKKAERAQKAAAPAPGGGD